MLQATIYADRSAIENFSACDLANRAAPEPMGSILGRWIARGRNLLRGGPDEHISDHLLADIGLSRADIQALSDL